MALGARDGAELQAVVRLAVDALGDEVLGAYAHGSTATGLLRQHSDLDVLVVVASPTTAAQRRAIAGGLLALSGAGPRPVELTIVVAGDVRPWRYPPRCDLLFGEWLRAGFEAGRIPDPAPSADLALVLEMTRRADRPLHGPAAEDLLDRVPPADLRRAVDDCLPGLLADLRHDTRNVLLTLARCWTTAATGAIRSKDEAADWAIARLPAGQRGLLATARDAYVGSAVDRWDGLDGQVDELAAAMVEAIGRLPVPPPGDA